MERPAGALWFSAAGGLLLKTTRKEREERRRGRGKKKSKGGGAERLALIAAELRRDALIAPRGCGQRRGEEEKVGGEVGGGSTVQDERG